jgi:Protein of unknown function (DUF3489)
MSRKTSRKPLTAAARLILDGASRRKSHAALPWPKALKLDESDRLVLVEDLLARGLLREEPARKRSEAWRTDDYGHAFSLIATDAGLAKASASAKPAAADHALSATRATKADTIVRLLQSKTGATLSDLMTATGWQAHSIRGFLSAVVGKRLGLDLRSVKTPSGERRYSIEAQ